MAASVDNAGRLALLAQEAAGCTRCRLAETRSNVVFGEGNPTAPLVFVGEGPGQTEDATGRPFVGRAGALLDECMGAVGITRKHVYICNVLKCRACITEEGRTRNRAPQQDEMDACAPWLRQQLEIISPLVIVCRQQLIEDIDAARRKVIEARKEPPRTLFDL